MNKFLACFVLIAILSCASAEMSFWQKAKLVATTCWNMVKKDPVGTLKNMYDTVMKQPFMISFKEHLAELGNDFGSFLCKNLLHAPEETCDKMYSNYKELIK